MDRTKLITCLLFSVMLWLAIGIAMAFAKSPFAHEHGPFEYFQISSALIGPLILGFYGFLWEQKPSNSVKSKILVNLLAIFLAVFAYILATQVIGRATDVISSFAEANIPINSFSRSTAKVFSALALPHICMAWLAIAKAPRGSLACRVGFASLFMVLGACGLYLALGLSPLVVWRD